jgi:hypothetical protein
MWRLKKQVRADASDKKTGTQGVRPVQRESLDSPPGCVPKVEKRAGPAFQEEEEARMSIRGCAATHQSHSAPRDRQWLEAIRCAAGRRREYLDRMQREHDEDGDRVPDARDNCRCAANPEQRDFDLDGRGDFCDHDDDNDSVPDSLDPAPYNPRIPGSFDMLTHST